MIGIHAKIGDDHTSKFVWSSLKSDLLDGVLFSPAQDIKTFFLVRHDDILDA